MVEAYKKKDYPAAQSLAKTFDAIDLGAELGAEIYVMWGGREGMECESAKDVQLALDRYAEAVDLCCAYVRERGYPLVFALEPKPNEPRANMYMANVGEVLYLISRLDLSAEEEALVLATLDPIGAMATTDEAKLKEAEARVATHIAEAADLGEEFDRVFRPGGQPRRAGEH